MDFAHCNNGVENANYCSDVQMMLVNSIHSLLTKKPYRKLKMILWPNNGLEGSLCIQLFLPNCQAHS